MKVTIPLPLPSMNKYSNAQRSNAYMGAKMKKDATNKCALYARKYRNLGVRFSIPCKLKFTWYTKDKREDPDNIASAKKFVLDGFQAAGLLENDTHKYIRGFVDEFEIDKVNPRVEIEEIA